jgi:hypothetical protein
LRRGAIEGQRAGVSRPVACSDRARC